MRVRERESQSCISHSSLFKPKSQVLSLGSLESLVAESVAESESLLNLCCRKVSVWYKVCAECEQSLIPKSQWEVSADSRRVSESLWQSLCRV